MALLSSPLTQNDLAHARDLANQGKLSEMYDFLASHGDRYAVLAKGVVEGNTLYGQAAIEFMKRTAEETGVRTQI